MEETTQQLLVQAQQQQQQVDSLRSRLSQLELEQVQVQSAAGELEARLATLGLAGQLGPYVAAVEKRTNNVYIELRNLSNALLDPRIAQDPPSLREIAEQLASLQSDLQQQQIE